MCADSLDAALNAGVSRRSTFVSLAFRVRGELAYGSRICSTMDEQTISNMRLRSRTCRRLADAQTDDEVAATLRKMADDIDADIARTAHDGNPQPMPPPPA
jgi:hypothetical protein